VKIFKNNFDALAWAMSAFSIIGGIARFNQVGLNGIFADLYAWYHAIAHAIFTYILAWPVLLIWPELRVPAWIMDVAVTLYVLTLMGSRIVAAHAVESMAKMPAGPIRRTLAYVTFAVIIYVFSLGMTVTLVGPAASVYAILKGGAFVIGWPKSWTLIMVEGAADRAELRGIYVRTFWGAVATAMFVVAFFVLNAYAPGELADIPG
jgi:hypothetical protein